MENINRFNSQESEEKQTGRNKRATRRELSGRNAQAVWKHEVGVRERKTEKQNEREIKQEQCRGRKACS